MLTELNQRPLRYLSDTIQIQLHACVTVQQSCLIQSVVTGTNDTVQLPFIIYVLTNFNTCLFICKTLTGKKKLNNHRALHVFDKIHLRGQQANSCQFHVSTNLKKYVNMTKNTCIIQRMSE